jgi:hypothetical protein
MAIGELFVDEEDCPGYISRQLFQLAVFVNIVDHLQSQNLLLLIQLYAPDPELIGTLSES